MRGGEPETDSGTDVFARQAWKKDDSYMDAGINPSDPTLPPCRPPYLAGDEELIAESPWPETRVAPQLGRGAGTEVTLVVDAPSVDARIAGP